MEAVAFVLTIGTVNAEKCFSFSIKPYFILERRENFTKYTHEYVCCVLVAADQFGKIKKFSKMLSSPLLHVTPQLDYLPPARDSQGRQDEGSTVAT